MYWQEALDQSIHAGAAFLIVYFLSKNPSYLRGALLGAFPGVVRELSEQGPRIKLHHFNFDSTSLLDIFFWTLGGLIAVYYVRKKEIKNVQRYACNL